MIKMEIDDIKKRVYVEVDGYITNEDSKIFIREYRSKSKSLKGKNYNLVVVPKIFDYDNENDIRDVCMTFFKTGYKKIYMVNQYSNIIETMKLSNFERKMFVKMVNTVNSLDEIK